MGAAELMREQLLLAAILSIAGTATAPPQLTEMRAQLHYEETGTLSPDILTTKDFVLWNTIIGEGSADEIANNLLVSVHVKAARETMVGPLRIIATGRGNRRVIDRTFDGILTSSRGDAWKAVLLYDIGCEGPLTITARLGRSTIVKTLRFACGE